MADLNLDGLRPDQLEKIKTGAVSGLNADQIAAMADVFREDNTTLPPEQAPPAPGAPLPSGLVPGGYLADLTKSVPGVAPIKRSRVEEYKKAHEFLQGKVDDQNKAAVKSMAYGVSAATGLPWWLQGVNTAATSTPGDLATLGATMGMAGGLQGVKSGVRALNVPLRAAQGLGIYGVGKTINDVTNGRPVEFGLKDLLLGGLSAGLGGMQGAIETSSIKVSPFELWKSHQAKIADVEQQIAKAQESIKPAKFAADDANTRLSQFEKTLADKLSHARGQSKENFQSTAAALRHDEQALGFQLDQQKENVKKAAETIQAHKDAVSGTDRFVASNKAEETANQILDLQKRLDGLRNPDTADLHLGSSENEQALLRTIEEQKARLLNPKYNAGAKAQQQDLLDRTTQALEDHRETRLRQTIDETKAKIRELQVQQRRYNQGRDALPTTEELAADQKLLQLHGNHTEAQKALEELNQKYQAKILERLSHAKNAPGATTADVQDVLTHRKLIDAARAAVEAHRETQMAPDRLNTQLVSLRNTAPEKPGMLSMNGSKLVHAILPALGGAGFSGLVHTAPLAGALGGAATDALLSTAAGQKLLAFLNQTVGSNGLNTVPSIVNQSGKK